MSQNTTAMQCGAGGETTGATDMTTRQPEALRLAEILEGGYSLAWLYERGGYAVSAELRRQHARITELESQLAQRFDAADMATASAQGFRDGVASAASWISVDERLPEPGNPVLLDIGKKYPIRALWAAKNTVRVGTDVDDCGEYDEETDEYYCPEGWYEWNEHEDVHWAVSETPRAWRELPPPLPAAPTAQAADSVTAPAPPPECETEAEKRAFAFGWFKALESERMKAESVLEDAARYRWLAASCRSTSEHWGGRWSIIIDGPAPKSHDSEDDFDAAVDAARKQGANHD